MLIKNSKSEQENPINFQSKGTRTLSQKLKWQPCIIWEHKGNFSSLRENSSSILNKRKKMDQHTLDKLLSVKVNLKPHYIQTSWQIWSVLIKLAICQNVNCGKFIFNSVPGKLQQEYDKAVFFLFEIHQRFPLWILSLYHLKRKVHCTELLKFSLSNTMHIICNQQFDVLT